MEVERCEERQWTGKSSCVFSSSEAEVGNGQSSRIVHNSLTVKLSLFLCQEIL